MFGSSGLLAIGTGKRGLGEVVRRCWLLAWEGKDFDVRGHSVGGDEMRYRSVSVRLSKKCKHHVTSDASACQIAGASCRCAVSTVAAVPGFMYGRGGPTSVPDLASQIAPPGFGRGRGASLPTLVLKPHPSSAMSPASGVSGWSPSRPRRRTFDCLCEINRLGTQKRKYESRIASLPESVVILVCLAWW